MTTTRSSPVSGFFYLLKTGVVAQALTFLSVILVMYKYDPGSFGVFTLIISVATLISAVSALRIERALVVEPAPRVPRLLSICIALTTVSAVLCLIILGTALVLQDRASSLLSLPAALGAFYCLLTGIGQVLSHIAIRDQQLPLIGISELAFAVILVVLIWLLEPGKESSTTLLVIHTTARLVSLTSYLRLDLHKWRGGGGDVTPLSELLKYGSSVFTTILSNLQFRGIYYLSGLYFGSAATGTIALAHRVMYAPINLIGSAMRRAYFREFAQSEDSGLIRSHVRKVLTYGSMLSAMLLPVIRLLLDRIDFLIPEKWGALPDLLLVLYPSASILVLLSWLDRVYDAHGKQHLALRYEAAYTVLLYLTLAVLLSGADPIRFLSAYTLITVAYNVVWAWLTLRMLGVATSTVADRPHQCAMQLDEKTGDDRRCRDQAKNPHHQPGREQEIVNVHGPVGVGDPIPNAHASQRVLADQANGLMVLRYPRYARSKILERLIECPNHHHGNHGHAAEHGNSERWSCPGSAKPIDPWTADEPEPSAAGNHQTYRAA